ncbi:carboxylate-amine ligase [Streptomyces sp. NPDC003016]
MEEEFLLVDQVSRCPAGRGGPVVRAGRERLGADHVEAEISLTMVETVSAVCMDGRELTHEVTRLRQGAAREAARRGCLLLATGTAPLGEAGPPPILDKPRYHAIERQFGSLTREQAVCSCHVHVGVTQREEAVRVVNHLRPWLPALLAVSANSPFWHGSDTGYASWRSMVWGRWPTAGPPPYLESAAHYEALVSSLVASGAALDPAMLYWYVRPSRHVPTVEVRVADVMPTVADTVAFALLVRALVRKALADVRRGREAPRTCQALLAAGCWQAARGGLRGELLDLAPSAVGSVLPAARRLAELREVTAPWHTDARERTFVRDWLDNASVQGTGADRQRAVRARSSGLEAVVDFFAVSVEGPGH